MAPKKPNESETKLIKLLYDTQAITVVPSDNGIEVEVVLQQIICRDPLVRKEVARMFERTLEKMFPVEMRSAEYRYGCVGTHAIAAIMGLLPCPIVTIAPDTLATPRPHVRGKLDTQQPFVLVDDLLKTGETLSRELAFLLHLSYNIGTIVVFYDREIGGQNKIREEYKTLSRQHFGREQEIKIVVLMPREKILRHLAEAKAILRQS